jgi:hypothetical protein
MVLKWILRLYDINKAKLKAPEKSYVYNSKNTKRNYIFSLLISSSPLILLSKSDSESVLNRSLKETPKSVVTLFLSSSLIVIPLATSCAVYKRPLLLSSTSIMSIVLSSTKIGAALLVRVGTHGRLRYDHSELTGRAYGP